MGDYKNKNKEEIKIKNITMESKSKENESKENIELADKYLDEGNYEKAKKAYEELISIQKNNKDIYIKIKDKYLEKRDLTMHII
jgi:Tfp pilus assembly protein PilF